MKFSCFFPVNIRSENKLLGFPKTLLSKMIGKFTDQYFLLTGDLNFHYLAMVNVFFLTSLLQVFVYIFQENSLYSPVGTVYATFRTDAIV